MKNLITFIGSAMAVCSLLLGKAVQYSPNRVLTGNSYSFFEFFAVELFGSAAVLLLVLSMVLLAGSFYQFRFSDQVSIGITLLLGILLMTFTADAILKPEFVRHEFGRVSLGGGFWLFLGGLFTCILGTKKYRRAGIAALLLILAYFVASGQLD